VADRDRKLRPRLALRHYLQESTNSGTPRLRLVRDYVGWRTRQGGSALDDREPWLTFAARRRLDQIVRPGMRVFEYGSGGSTLWFADRGANDVSVEHDPDWCRRVAEHLPVGVTLVLIEPEPASVQAGSVDYESSDPRYRGMSFEAYAQSVTGYAPVDLVLVDGRARIGSARAGMNAVKPGGWLVLDDSQRTEYAEIFKLIAWPFERFPGPKPYSEAFAETTIWRRPAAG